MTFSHSVNKVSMGGKSVIGNLARLNEYEWNISVSKLASKDAMRWPSLLLLVCLAPSHSRAAVYSDRSRSTDAPECKTVQGCLQSHCRYVSAPFDWLHPKEISPLSQWGSPSSTTNTNATFMPSATEQLYMIGLIAIHVLSFSILENI